MRQPAHDPDRPARGIPCHRSVHRLVVVDQPTKGERRDLVGNGCLVERDVGVPQVEPLGVVVGADRSDHGSRVGAADSGRLRTPRPSLHRERRLAHREHRLASKSPRIPRQQPARSTLRGDLAPRPRPRCSAQSVRISASPCPPPPQSPTAAVPLPRRPSSCTACTTSRAPDAPIGCPMAMPPP